MSNAIVIIALHSGKVIINKYFVKRATVFKCEGKQCRVLTSELVCFHPVLTVSGCSLDGTIKVCVLQWCKLGMNEAERHLKICGFHQALLFVFFSFLIYESANS